MKLFSSQEVFCNLVPMRTYAIYCGGQFIETNEPLLIKNKFTGKNYAKTFLANRIILDKAIEQSQLALEPCKSLSSFEKRKALTFISQQIEKNKNRLAELLCIESAKPIRYAIVEIERAAETFQIAAEECQRLPKEFISLDRRENAKGKFGFVNYFPIGIVAGISPFNFPLNLAVHKIAPAIASGCPIILKPSSLTPLSTLELAKIISHTDLPLGAVSILPMNRSVGNSLVEDERINMLSFTGSPEVGWNLKRQSGKKKVVLELGGNAGVIISDNVEVQGVVAKCIQGAFAYSGQICIHAQRFFVHENQFEKFSKLMMSAVKKLKCGNPLLAEIDISNLIDEKNAIRIEEWVNEAKQQGAKILCGGKRKGTFYAPTILTNTKTNMKVNAEEVFGPVVCIEKYSGSIKNAINMINDSKYGLQCGVFTDSIEELDAVFQSAEVGGVLHNQVPTVRYDEMPYGGIKESGLGREGVRYAIADMLEPKILVK